MTDQQPSEAEAATEPQAIFVSDSPQIADQAHVNIRRDILVVTEDKIRLCLQRHLQASKDIDSWQAPVAMLATIILAFTTATFKDFIVKAATWEAVFLVGGALSAAWTVVAARKSWAARSMEQSIDQIVTDLKQAAATMTAPAGQSLAIRKPPKKGGR